MPEIDREAYEAMLEWHAIRRKRSRRRFSACSSVPRPIKGLRYDEWLRAGIRTRGEGSGQHIVTVVTVVNRKDSKSEPYTTTWFDMWRIVDGKVDEHWDPMIKP